MEKEPIYQPPKIKPIHEPGKGEAIEADISHEEKEKIKKQFGL